MLNTLDLKPGFILRFKSFGNTEKRLRIRLMVLGLMPGVEVKLVRVAPLGCPLYFNLGEINLALRKDEAKHLLWEKL
ncbi:MAG: hypothetical protein A3F18_03510 [Legionellales bacterium RIFCSPHIGHO2_12_FULL_37_14]|nr:MAG: hypothetical protein A3F18_03510 [Legionellales bacterium RIFCSPHIGHO2_12_FULL_37_14]